MAVSEVSICNQAISWLAGTPITSLDDDTVEAILCKANYELARNAVLEDRAWTFATRRFVLTPEAEKPAWGYGQQYLIPPEIIRVLEVHDADNQRLANGPSDMDWRREENRIVCNRAKIYVKALVKIEDPERFTPAFVQCLAARIAADIAIPLTESTQMQKDMWALYQVKLADAAATDGSQGRSDIMESRELIIVRQ